MVNSKISLKDELKDLITLKNLGGMIIAVTTTGFLMGNNFITNILQILAVVFVLFIICFIIRWLVVLKKKKTKSNYTKVKDTEYFIPIVNLILDTHPNATSGKDIKDKLGIPYKKFNKIVYYLKEKKVVRIETPPQNHVSEYYYIWVEDTDKMEGFLE